MEQTCNFSKLKHKMRCRDEAGDDVAAAAAAVEEEEDGGNEQERRFTVHFR
jgi:hypothetical protein